MPRTCSLQGVTTGDCYRRYTTGVASFATWHVTQQFARRTRAGADGADALAGMFRQPSTMPTPSCVLPSMRKLRDVARALVTFACGTASNPTGTLRQGQGGDALASALDSIDRRARALMFSHNAKHLSSRSTSVSLTQPPGIGAAKAERGCRLENAYRPPSLRHSTMLHSPTDELRRPCCWSCSGWLLLAMWAFPHSADHLLQTLTAG